MKTKKLKGFMVLPAVVMSILIGMLGLSFLQIYSGQFSALSANRKALQAQQYAMAEADILRNTAYDQLNSAVHDKTAISGGNGWLSTAQVGGETTINGVKQRLGTVEVYRNDSVSSPDFSFQFPLSNANSGYVKNNNANSGIISMSVSGGYLHGYYNGVEYPFYFNGYTKSETYTKAEVNNLIAGLQSKITALTGRVTALENKTTGSLDWSKAGIVIHGLGDYTDIELKNFPVSSTTGGRPRTKYVDFKIHYYNGDSSLSYPVWHN